MDRKGLYKGYPRERVCWHLDDSQCTRKVPAWHPIRDEFERVSGHAQKGMFGCSNSLPRYSHLIERL
jgi:hypothetical protein